LWRRRQPRGQEIADAYEYREKQQQAADYEPAQGLWRQSARGPEEVAKQNEGKESYTLTTRK